MPHRSSSTPPRDARFRCSRVRSGDDGGASRPEGALCSARSPLASRKSAGLKFGASAGEDTFVIMKEFITD